MPRYGKVYWDAKLLVHDLRALNSALQQVIGEDVETFDDLISRFACLAYGSGAGYQFFTEDKSLVLAKESLWLTMEEVTSAEQRRVEVTINGTDLNIPLAEEWGWVKID